MHMEFRAAECVGSNDYPATARTSVVHLREMLYEYDEGITLPQIAMSDLMLWASACFLGIPLHLPLEEHLVRQLYIQV